VKKQLYDRLFGIIVADPDARGVVLRRGTLIDATIVQSARRPCRKADDEETTLRQKAQQDRDAEFTKKGKKTHYGYKGHIGVDEGSGVIRKKVFTAANVHDSKETDALISGDERSVSADKAYVSEERKRGLRKKGVFCGIPDKGYRNRPLAKKQKKMNRKKSRVRSAVERPFARFKHLYGYRRSRYVNTARNDLRFTFLCIIHNVRRGIAPAAA
jgi:transposase, IS5 family